MPRPNSDRNFQVEEFLARRIAKLRRENEWSYRHLAELMGDVGCAVEPSALQKIEKGQPRRRIVTNELLAFAMIFNVSVADLLMTDGDIPAGDTELSPDQIRRIVTGGESDDTVKTDVLISLRAAQRAQMQLFQINQDIGRLLIDAEDGLFQKIEESPPEISDRPGISLGDIYSSFARRSADRWYEPKKGGDLGASEYLEGLNEDGE